MKQTNIFVYGSLRPIVSIKKNSVRHMSCLKQSAYLGSGITKDSFILTDLGAFPGLLEHPNGKSSNSNRVLGDVYNISEETLSCLDSYEQEGSLYFRKPIKIINFPDLEIESYFINPSFIPNFDPIDLAPLNSKNLFDYSLKQGR